MSNTDVETMNRLRQQLAELTARMESEKKRSSPRVAVALANVAPTHQVEEDESEDFEQDQISYPSAHTNFHLKHNIDMSVEENVVWLQQICLWNFANLPWDLWCTNPNAQS